MRRCAHVSRDTAVIRLFLVTELCKIQVSDSNFGGRGGGNKIIKTALTRRSCQKLQFKIQLKILSVIERNPCSPSPCGLNSQCRELNGQAVCSCSPTFIGAPPNCRPECTVSSDCSVNRACKNRKCVDPCPGICGINARCEVINHSPICSCNQGFTGDPFVTCFATRKYATKYELLFFFTFLHI